VPGSDGGRPEITVSMPTYRTPTPELRRAVTAVLGQRCTSLRLIIVSDGHTPGTIGSQLGKLAHDPRVVVHELPEHHNRGRYFADAVTLAACSTPFWTIHDSDDEASGTWLSVMLEKMIECDARECPLDVVFTDQHVVSTTGRTGFDPVKYPSPGHPVRFGHYAHAAGLWRTETLRRIGGPCPAYRVGWDSMLSTIAMAELETFVIELMVSAMPLYTRHKRRGSLTMSPQTGLRSDYRASARRAMVGLWSEMCVELDTHASPLTASERQGLIGSMVRRSVDPSTWIEVQAEAARLRRVIDEKGRS